VSGAFSAAHGGTLVLDEVFELPPSLQAGLLLLLERAAAGDAPAPPRIIATAGGDLEERVASGRFLQELFVRLNVLELCVPPLRRSKADLLPLSGYFLHQLTPSATLAPGISRRAWCALAEYAYPGNVKELRSAIESALGASGGAEIDLEHLPSEISAPGRSRAADAVSPTLPLAEAALEFEREYLIRALAVGDHEDVAVRLGISAETLAGKLSQHGIDVGPTRRAHQPPATEMPPPPCPTTGTIATRFSACGDGLVK